MVLQAWELIPTESLCLCVSQSKGARLWVSGDFSIGAPGGDGSRAPHQDPQLGPPPFRCLAAHRHTTHADI